MKLQEVKPKLVFPGFGSSAALALKKTIPSVKLLAAAKKQFKDKECMSQKLGWELQRFSPCFQIKSCQDKRLPILDMVQNVYF